jgi:formylglycine-generating enzyme required for sulfatase activity
MSGELRQPVVFISAVTSELGKCRDALIRIVEDHGGAKPDGQRDFPSSLSDGLAIQHAIDQADVVVCLVGHCYGAELAKGNRPPEAEPGCSWTQWEYLYARKHAKELRLFMFDGPKAGSEPKKLSDRQAKFRKKIEKDATSTFGERFFRRFDTLDKLVADVTQYVHNLDGILAQFQEGTWSTIRTKYRRCTVDAWQRDFQNVYRGKKETSAEEKERLMGAPLAPFIASQRFSILEPKDGRQLHALRPAAFLPGRSTETEAAARERSTWNPVPRASLQQVLLNGKSEQIELGGVALSHPIRLFLVSGGGVGKTTNMRWLEWMCNAANAPVAGAPRRDGHDTGNISTADTSSSAVGDSAAVLAIRVNAGAIANMDDDQILQHLVGRIATEIGAAKSKWALEAIAWGLDQDAQAQRLVILVDGLDHVETGKVPFLLSIQSEGPGRRWWRCPVIAAGRPNAIQGWRDGVALAEDKVALGQWRFIEPSEFEPDEAEVFLGYSQGLSRYSLVATQLGDLARVPRVLEYVRTLPGERLRDVRTSADVYERALRELIKRTLKEGPKDSRKIGPQWLEDCERDQPPGSQVQYIMMFLSVLAFLSLCPTTDADFAERRSDAFKMSISKDVRRFIRERLVEVGLYDSANLDRDFRALAGFATVLGNGVLDATDSDAENFNSLVWSNRTIQQFLAAYWLAVHARGFDVFRQRLEGKAVDVPPEDPLRDTDRLRHYLYHAEDAGADTTYELNMFLAEMPATTPLNPSSWVASASAWYDPNIYSSQPNGAASTRKWSTEMLYRSWAHMHDIAGYPFDDWWDLSYDALIKNLSGSARAAASVHRLRDKSGLDTNPAARRAARKVLDRFYGDFGSTLEGRRGAEQQAAAREMIAAQNWITVPAGEFRMGAPGEKQGFPPKVRAYWIRDLDEVQTKAKSAEAVARRSTKQEWFTGVQGKKLREDDIMWLTETFSRVEPPPGASHLEVPNRNTPEYQTALKILEDKWSRHDETPAENPQQVASFVMHQLPILHRWYHLFAPGHRLTVTEYLEPTPHPPDDNPAIYISWFDAWAFCQWATWTVDDPAAKGGRRRFGLRLPHELEWEFAARWAPNGAGQPEPIQYGQRYWWGDEFYRAEDSPEPEPLSNELAHTIGVPGQTRAPVKAAPNGLGFRDILGNVWEWTANVYEMRKEEEYSRAFPQQPAERPAVNCLRTMRGGLWYYLDLLANCTARFRLSSNDRDYKMGFRVVCEERSLM